MVKINLGRRKTLARLAAAALLIVAALGGSVQKGAAAVPPFPVPPASVIDMNAVYDLEFSFGSPVHSDPHATAIEASVQNFENNAIQEVCADHQISSCSSAAVLSWARPNLVAQEWADLDAIITLQASGDTICSAAVTTGCLQTPLSPGDISNVFGWFQLYFQQQQVAADSDAISEYLTWSGLTASTITDPPQDFGSTAGTGFCGFQPPSAPAYTGNQNPLCYTPCPPEAEVVGACDPDVPAIGDFEQWGTFDAQQAQVSTPGYYATLTATAAAEAAGTAVAIGGGVVSPIVAALGVSGLQETALQTALFPNIYENPATVARAAQITSRFFNSTSRVLTPEEDAAADAPADATSEEVGADATDAAVDASADAAADISAIASTAATAGAITFVVGIVVFAIVSSVLEFYQIYTGAQVPVGLEAKLSTDQTTPPDVATAIAGTSGWVTGLDAFTAATITAAPEVCVGATSSGLPKVGDPLCTQAPAIPSPSTGDPAFLVSANGSAPALQPSIYSVGTGGEFDLARMSGNGWFVDQKYDPTIADNATSPGAASGDAGAAVQSLDFYYLDWSGNPWEAELVTPTGCASPQLVAVPLDPSDTSAATPTSSDCGGTSGIQFQEPNGYNGTPIDATATIAAGGATEPTLSFSYTAPIIVGHTATFTATGTDPFNSPLSYTWSLPAQWNNNQLTCTQLNCFTSIPGQSINFNFTTSGDSPGSVTVTDQDGFSRTEHFVVAVGDTTTTTVTSSANPSVSGQPITVTATVDPDNPYNNVPLFFPPTTGYVQFYRDGVIEGGPVPVTPSHVITTAAGTATMTLPPLAITGSPYSVSATYLGSSNDLVSGFNPSGGGEASATLSQAVQQGSTSIDIEPSTTPTIYGQAVSFTAAVAPTAPAQGTPTGTVQFYADGNAFGSPVPLDAYGTATSESISALKTNNGPFGLPDVGAVYAGDGNFSTASQSMFQVVNADPTTTTVTSSANPSPYGQPVTFTASVTGSALSIAIPNGTVQFSIDGTAIGTPVSLDASGDATLTTTASDVLAVTGTGTSFPAGHAIDAEYLGPPTCPGCFLVEPDFSTSGNTLQQSVGQASTSTTLRSSANPSMQTRPVTFTATVAAGVPGLSVPTGSVTFKNGSAVLGTAPVNTGGGVTTSSLTISNLSLGPHSITAVYSGNSALVSSTSLPLSQQVDTNLTHFPKLADGAYNLSGANLHGAYLYGLSLIGADLNNANFTGAVMTDVNLFTASMSNANFTNARLINVGTSRATMSSANFTSASFTNVTLSLTNMTKANFKNARFAGANFTGSNLTLANLLGATGLSTATLSGVIWNRTVCPDDTISNNDGRTCLGHL